MKEKVLKLKEKADKQGKNWKEIKVDFEENSLVGYSKDKSLADTYGAHVNGVTATKVVDVEDIIFDFGSLFKKGVDPEGEIIILGAQTEQKLGIFSWRD